MRLIFISDYAEKRTPEHVDDMLQTVVDFTGIDTLGGLFTVNDHWERATTDECTEDFEARLDFALQLKLLARGRGMFFWQPIIKLDESDLLENIQRECLKRGWEGQYLLVPANWKFIDGVNLLTIENQLNTSGCNYIHLPTKADEDSWTQEHEAQTFEPIPEEGVADDAPHFGNLTALITGQKTGHYVWSNGGRMKAVVVKE